MATNINTQGQPNDKQNIEELPPKKPMKTDRAMRRIWMGVGAGVAVAVGMVIVKVIVTSVFGSKVKTNEVLQPTNDVFQSRYINPYSPNTNEWACIRVSSGCNGG